MNSWFQMDGAPAHYGRQVRAWINENYPQRWIGRLTQIEAGNGPVAWPPRSPDITPMDFYVWGHLKDIVYATTVETREELVERIEKACRLLKGNRPQVLAAVNSVTTIIEKWIEAGEFHFKNL